MTSNVDSSLCHFFISELQGRLMSQNHRTAVTRTQRPADQHGHSQLNGHWPVIPTGDYVVANNSETEPGREQITIHTSQLKI